MERLIKILILPFSNDERDFTHCLGMRQALGKIYGMPTDACWLDGSM